jgi:hypothetical protein
VRPIDGNLGLYETVLSSRPLVDPGLVLLNGSKFSGGQGMKNYQQGFPVALNLVDYRSGDFL